MVCRIDIPPSHADRKPKMALGQDFLPALVVLPISKVIANHAMTSYWFLFQCNIDEFLMPCRKDQADEYMGGNRTIHTHECVQCP